MRKGLLISVEGSEASGKSTQLNMLFTQIRVTYPGLFVAYTAEPSPLVRELVTQEEIGDAARLFLIAAGRAETHRKIIKPALEKGAVCLTDRYLLSTLVYQHQHNELAWLTHYYAADNVHPDLTVVLNVPAEVAQERLKERGELDVLEDVPLSELERRNDRFVEIAEAMPDMTVIDGDAPIGAVQARLWLAVRPLLDKMYSAGGEDESFVSIRTSDLPCPDSASA